LSPHLSRLSGLILHSDHRRRLADLGRIRIRQSAIRRSPPRPPPTRAMHSWWVIW